MVKKIIVMLKKSWKKVRFECELRKMDELWYFMGGSCFGLFPPSFYHRHSDEEAKRIMEETLAKLNAIIDDYAEKHGLSKTESEICQQDTPGKPEN